MVLLFYSRSERAVTRSQTSSSSADEKQLAGHSKPKRRKRSSAGSSKRPVKVADGPFPVQSFYCKSDMASSKVADGKGSSSDSYTSDYERY